MELKKYQQDTIDNLERFLEKVQALKETKEAFHSFWATHPITPLQPFPGSAVEPYKNNVPGVPNICLKVPTAGGKTFIACNALKSVFDAFDDSKSKAVVWLVPSITILEQTLKNLKDPSHPYRQKINSHFNNKVEVFDKAALLQGNGFTASSVAEQLNIFVLSFDSLRAKNKEERKVFQENGNLQSFGSLLGTGEEISVMKVIRLLNPVVIVDESHNAESELSVDMLANLNPCLILDLTATPRNNSNIISFTDAIELKKENMVKLPVIVYNHHDKTEVVNSALQLQRKLELQAIEEQKAGGKYIRPIVLFQAQPKNAADSTTFEKLKEKLIELKIPAEQIRIKTADINEIRSEDLLSPDCPVRYIITVNALKEGWDCPFAYILASLADKSSAVDVEQILGRVLRQPYVAKHQFPLLNVSYVLTASSRFLETLDNIVKGLNKAGFSSNDYKLAADTIADEESRPESFTQLTIIATENDQSAQPDDSASDIDTTRISAMIEPSAPAQTVISIESVAIEQVRHFESALQESASGNGISLPPEIQSLVKTYTIKETFREPAAGVTLPAFYLKIPANTLFGQLEETVLLDKINLLEGLQLSKVDTNIVFDDVSSELYKIDLDVTKKDHTPTFIKLDGHTRKSLMDYILDPSRKENRVQNLGRKIAGLLGKIDPISAREIEQYAIRIITDFSEEQINDLIAAEFTYADKIKAKIRSLSEAFAENRFREYLDTDKVIMQPSFSFPVQIIPGETGKDLPKSLYEREGRMNGFEEAVINEVANLENIAFWTRNLERRGFYINGFINHYPDFIIHTKNGKTILLETKGDHLDAEQKIRLGNLWASKAGNAYRYFMVYERRVVDNAYTLDNFVKIIREL